MDQEVKERVAVTVYDVLTYYDGTERRSAPEEWLEDAVFYRLMIALRRHAMATRGICLAEIKNFTDDGVPFPDVLIAKGIVPGIKVDTGTVELHGFKGEVVTQGLDNLAARFAEYYDLGARFAK